MNRWAGDVVRAPPAAMNQIRDAIMTDLYGYAVQDPNMPPSVQVQNLLRHILSDAIAEGIINCLIVTNSTEANVHLTRIHDHLFSRKRSVYREAAPVFMSPSGDPLVACVWRRQTFSAAVESFTPEMGENILSEHMRALASLLSANPRTMAEMHEILTSAYSFSRMLHAGQAGATTDAFYRAFVPEVGHPLDPGQLELVKRCMKSERGQVDTVGACVFPGLVKVTLAPEAANGQNGQMNGGDNTVSTVVRRAQVICQCALTGGIPTPQPTPTEPA